MAGTQPVSWAYGGSHVRPSSAFCNTDSVQVLGEPGALFASLRVDVWLSIGRTVSVGGKEAEVGGRGAGKF